MIEEEAQTFAVVTNPEEQYSIWPEARDLPEGWVAVGPSGPKEECLDYIERVWTDMRPRSLRIAIRDREGGSLDAPSEEDGSVRRLVEDTLSQHDAEVEAYAEGRPELYGWFLARILDAAEDDQLDPDAVRTELNRQLPDVH